MIKFRRFHYILYGVLAAFAAVMVHATYRAYGRSSGSTGMDAARIQEIRYEIYKAHADAKESPTIQVPPASI